MRTSLVVGTFNFVLLTVDVFVTGSDGAYGIFTIEVTTFGPI